MTPLELFEEALKGLTPKDDSDDDAEPFDIIGEALKAASIAPNTSSSASTGATFETIATTTSRMTPTTPIPQCTQADCTAEMGGVTYHGMIGKPSSISTHPTTLTTLTTASTAASAASASRALKRPRTEAMVAASSSSSRGNRIQEGRTRRVRTKSATASQLTAVCTNSLPVVQLNTPYHIPIPVKCPQWQTSSVEAAQMLELRKEENEKQYRRTLREAFQRHREQHLREMMVRQVLGRRRAAANKNAPNMPVNNNLEAKCKIVWHQH